MMPPVAILAGGLATRLYPITTKIPKALLEIAGKPFIAYQLELLRRQEVNRVVICVGYLGELIKDFVREGQDFDITVEYSFDGEHLLGTGGAIKKALPLLGEEFFIVYGDSYLETDLKSILTHHRSQKKMGLMTVFRNENQWDTSNIVYQDGRIVQYDKKKRIREMQYIDYGLSILREECFAEFPDKGFDLSEVYQSLIARSEMAGYEVKERFYEIGSFQGLEETTTHLEKQMRG